MVEPISAIQAVKHFRQVRSELSKYTPDSAREKAYDEILEEVMLETNALVRALPETLYQAAVRALHDLFPEWEGDPEHFSPHDVVDALRQLFIERTRAGTNKKREILERAFFSRFRPDVYKAGESRLLWDIVRQLEYPEVWAVRELVGLHEKHMQEPYRGNPKEILVVARESTTISYLRKFERMGLIREIRGGSGAVELILLPMAIRLKEFVWVSEWHPLDEAK